VITAVAILSLALGIGANTAIFSLINALLLRPLPVHDPEQLVSIYTIGPEHADANDPLSIAMFEEIRRQQQVFSTMFSWSGGGINNFEADGVKFAGSLSTVSGEYYASMGVQPVLGRLIQPDDVPLRAGTPAAVAVLEYDCWQHQFQGDPNVIGKVIRLEADHPLRIIGVSSKGFSGFIIDGGADVTVPFGVLNLETVRSRRMLSLGVFARLNPGVSLEQARTQMKTIWPAIQAATVPEDYAGLRLKRFMARKIDVQSAERGRSSLRQTHSASLVLLMALAGLVLLIACVNLANLMLARAEGRRHEMAVRAALVAGAWRLVRPLLVESVMLSLGGAALGLLVAVWTSRLLLNTMWTGFLRLRLDVTPDGRVLIFTTAVAVTAGVLFGLAPAWTLGRTVPAHALRQNSRSVRGAGVLGKVLVTSQVALSMILVLAAALLVHSLEKMTSLDPGFRGGHVLRMQLIAQAGRRKFTNKDYYRNVVTQLSRLPGVVSVSFSVLGPVSNFEYKDTVAADGVTSSQVQSVSEVAGPGFFRTIGMKVMMGREFEWRDDDKAPKVAVISESLSKRLFPGSDPIGKTVIIRPGAYQELAVVTGVVNSASLWRIQSRELLAIYRPLLQSGELDTAVDIRTAGDPRSLASVAPRVVESMGNEYSIRTQTLEERYGRMLVQERMTAWLAAFFGALAMLLAAIGLYGLMSYAVTRRTAEIGIRMALGAERGTVMAMVLREVLLLVGAGIVIGIAGALGANRWIAGMLFGLSPTDPATTAIAAGILSVVALLAGYLPARYASRIDPMTALRTD
jgi:predicted permease